MNGKKQQTRLRVYYGWSKINKIQKREAIAVVFENEENAGWQNSRSGKSLRKRMDVCYERSQTEKEMLDAGGCNRVFTVYNIFLDDPKIKGSLEQALCINSMADQNHINEKTRTEIAEKLRAAYYKKHPDYKEPIRQLELFEEQKI